jgi:hypothetical protein
MSSARSSARLLEDQLRLAHFGPGAHLYSFVYRLFCTCDNLLVGTPQVSNVRGARLDSTHIPVSGTNLHYGTVEHVVQHPTCGFHPHPCVRQQLALWNR